DNLIVQKLTANPDSIGVFGFSYLEENRDKLKDIPLNGIEATYDNVASGEYPGARPLYIYVKKAHLQAIPGLKAYVEEFANGWAPDGYLTKRGMVASSEEVRTKSSATVKTMAVMDGSELH
ncbi:MAG: substrate-binding domain-containing protein, partial [Sphingobium sp.]